VDLRPGDALLLYTDGATELSTGGTERVGTEGLCRLVAAHGDKPAAEMVERILADLLAMAGGPARDDITLLAIKRKL